MNETTGPILDEQCLEADIRGTEEVLLSNPKAIKATLWLVESPSACKGNESGTG